MYQAVNKIVKIISGYVRRKYGSFVCLFVFESVLFLLWALSHTIVS